MKNKQSEINLVFITYLQKLQQPPWVLPSRPVGVLGCHGDSGVSEVHAWGEYETWCVKETKKNQVKYNLRKE